MLITDHRPRDAATQYDWVRCIREAAEITLTERGVALTLMSYANADGTSIRPGNDRLIAETGASEKTIKRSITALREHGWIRCVHQGGRNRGANEYRLTIPYQRLRLLSDERLLKYGLIRKPP